MAGLKLAGGFQYIFVKFLILFSYYYFFSSGLKIAVFKSGGTTPEARDVLMMLRVVGRRTSRFSYGSFVGMGSRSHDFGAFF